MAFRSFRVLAAVVFGVVSLGLVGFLECGVGIPIGSNEVRR